MICFGVARVRPARVDSEQKWQTSVRRLPDTRMKSIPIRLHGGPAKVHFLGTQALSNVCSGPHANQRFPAECKVSASWGRLRQIWKTNRPRNPDGRHKHQLHRRLSEDHGHPKLKEHLASVLTAMQLSDDYDDFLRKLDRVKPRFDETLQLPFEGERPKVGL
jgi:hypothetical protein